jgi:hypothetical protein
MGGKITTDNSEAAVHCGANLVSVKCIIVSIFEGTNDGASNAEHSGESMGAWAAEQVTVGATNHSFVHSCRSEIWGGSFGSIYLRISNSGWIELDTKYHHFFAYLL